MSPVRIVIGSFIIAGSALLTAACAGEDAALAPYPGGFVVAKSRFGNGVVRGQVRRAALGWKVQLPGGRWVYCRRNCAETLRVETIDFFQTNAAGSGQLTNECGIFGCLDLKYPH
jgi:hypothetical protein